MPLRLREAYDAWDDWSIRTGSKRLYFNVMTPTCGAASIAMLVIRQRLFAALWGGIALFGITVLARLDGSIVHRIRSRLLDRRPPRDIGH